MTFVWSISSVSGNVRVLQGRRGEQGRAVGGACHVHRLDTCLCAECVGTQLNRRYGTEDRGVDGGLVLQRLDRDDRRVRQHGVHVERELSTIGTDVDHVRRLQPAQHRLRPVGGSTPCRAAWRPILVLPTESAGPRQLPPHLGGQ